MFKRFRDRLGRPDLTRTRVADGPARSAPAPAIRALEPRFVLDAAAAATAATAEAAHSAEGADAETAQVAPNHPTEAAAAESHPQPVTADGEAAGLVATPPGERHEIVVIDRSVPDLQTLLAGVPQDAEIVLIEPGRDGLDQLAEALRGRSDVDAIHILSHGKAGDLRLGTAELTSQTIVGRYAEDLAAIGRALSASGDLLIYGCDFAAGETGAEAARLLARATGADVAASTDATGDVALGGDWQLERHEGAIEAGLAVDGTAQAAWHHLLAPLTISVNGAPTVRDGAGTQITATRPVAGVDYLDVSSGNTLGATATWTNVGTVGGIQVTLRATVIARGASDDAVSFGTSGDDASVLVRATNSTGTGSGAAGQITLRWDLLRADNGMAIAADVDLQIGDIDGVGGNPNTRETVTPSQTGLTSYATASTTDLRIDSTNNRISVSGTQNETASPPASVSIVRFNWANVSSWQMTYALAANDTTNQAAFQHDGDRTLTLTNPQTKLVPKIDLDQNDSSGATGNDYRTTFTEKGAAVSVTDTDPLATNTAAIVQRATVVLTNAKASDRLTVGTLPSDITGSLDTSVAGQITVTLTGNSTRANYQAALRAITFDNTSAAPDTTDRTLDTRLTSDDVQGTSARTTIAVIPVNDAPVNGLPAAQAFDEDTSLVFSTARGNAITVSDPDAGAGILSTTLQVASGTLTLGAAGGLAVTGDGTGTVTLNGTASQINIALNGTTYRPAENYNGAVGLQVTTNDGGNIGTGGAKQDSDTLALTVRAVDDPPVNTVPAGPRATLEDTDAVFSTATGNAITVSDPDGGTLTVTLSTTKGLLTLARTTGLTLLTGDGTGDATIRVRGTVSDINAALDGLRFSPTDDYNGNADISILTQDPSRTADNFVNGGFESPNIGNSANAQVNESTVPGWDTDASDNRIEIWSSGFNGVPAYEGNQFAEINATQVAALFQTFQSTAGGTLTVDFAHRGRLGTDTMQVVATDLGADGVVGTADDTVLMQETFTDGNTSWGAYTRTITQNASGDAVRFEFRSISAAGNSSSVGNFIDGVQILQSFQARSTATVAVTAVADIVADTLSTNQETAITFNAVTGTNGASADAFENADARVTAVTQGTYGTASFLPDGTLTYTPASGFSGRDTFTYIVTSGGVSETATVTMDVLPRNDAPVNGLPGAQSVAEDTDLTFSSAGGNALTIADPDAGGSTVTTSLSVGSGTLILGSTTGVTVGGDRTGAVTLTGTVAQINAALEGTVYRPAANANGAVTLTITTNDNGNTGTGGAKTDTDSLAITVTPVNDAPVNTLPGAQTLDEDGSLVLSSATNTAVTVSDVDAGGGSLTTLVSVSSGTLSLGSTIGVTVTGNGTAAVRLTGSAAQINAALDGTVYSPAANATGAVTFTVTTNDNGNAGAGGSKTDTDTQTFTVRPVNDAPVNGRPGAQSVAEDTDLTFSAARGNALTIADSDAGGSTVTTSLSVGSGTLILGSTTGVVATGNGTGAVSLTGTVAQINAALNGTIYRPATNINGAVTLSVTTNDNGNTGSGGARSDTDAVAITITPVNDAPVNGRPGAQSVAEDTDLTFSSAGGNALTIADPDAGGSSVTTSLGVGSGTLILGSTTGVVVSGNGTGAVSLTGTVAQINAALERTIYRPATNANGAVTLTITTNDNGNTGTGGAKSDSDTVAIAVTPVNDAPVNALPVAQALDEDGSLVFSTANHNALAIADVDAAVGPLTTILSAGSGTLTLGSTAGVTVSGNGTGAVTLTGTVAQINAALDGTTYSPVANANGAVTLTITTNDNGNTGAGGARSDTDTLALTITPANDAPTADSLPGRSSNDGQAVSLDLIGSFQDRDGDRLSFSDGGTLPPGLTVDPATGLISGTVDSAASGPTGATTYVVTLTATDPSGATASTSFSWRITNLPPGAADDTATVAEDTPATIDVIKAGSAAGTPGRDTDPDGDTLTLVGTGAQAPSAAHGTVTIANGALVYTPDADFNGTDTITYTVSDGNNGFSTASVAVTVTSVNDAPTVTRPLPDTTSRDDQTVLYDASAAFRDADIDPALPASQSQDGLSYTATGLPPGLSIDPTTGAISGTLPNTASVTPVYSVTVTATDRAGASVSAGFTWTVDNDVPIATPDAATTPERAPVTVAVTANDRDDDAFALVDEPGATTAGHGSVSVNTATGEITYTPEAGFNGDDAITYTIEDEQGARSTGVLVVTVTPVENAPDVSGPLPVRQGADGQVVAVDLSPFFSDADGDALTYTASALPTGLSIDPVTGTIAGTIDPSASGATGRQSYSVTVTATDPTGRSASGSFAWTVVNTPPAAGDDTAATSQDRAVDIDVIKAAHLPGTPGRDIDPDGDPLSVVAGSLSAAYGTVSLNPDGTLHYVPDPAFAGTDTILYTVQDGNGGLASAAVTVTVTAVDDAPVASQAPDRTGLDGTSVSVAAGGFFSDSDPGDRLTFTAVRLPPGLSLDPDTGRISGRLASDASTRTTGGAYAVILTATDRTGLSATTRFTWTIANQAPTAVDDSVTTAEDMPVTGSVRPNDGDPDADALSVDPTPVQGPAHGSLTLRADGSFTYTPGADFNGSDSFTYTLRDSDGGSSTATVHLTVTPVNDAPVASATPVTTAEDTPVTGRVITRDADADPLSFTVETPPTGGSVVLRPDGSFTYTPGAEAHGSDGFVVRVSDGHGGSTLVTVPVTVTPVNDAPVASVAPVTTPEDTPVTGRVTARDADGDQVSFTVETPPATGSVVLRPNGSFTYTPGADANGSDGFVVRVSDGHGGSTLVTVPVTVTPVNDAPVASVAPVTTAEDVPVTGRVTVQDADGDPPSFTVEAPPMGGSVVLRPDGSFTYTPGADANGSDGFVVRVSDGHGGSTLITIPVTVTPVGDAPVASVAPVTTPEDTPVTGRVTARDADGDPMSFTVETPPATGSVVLRPDGSFTYTPGADANGSDDFVVRVSDGNGGSTLVTVPVTVTPVNDAPVASVVPVATAEDVPVTGSIATRDADGDQVSFTVETPPATGSVVLRPDGSFTYTPGADANGSDGFVVRVSDGNGGSTLVTVPVTITPVNDAPTATLPPDRSGQDGQSVRLDLGGVFSDVDGDALVYAASGLPPGLSIDPATGLVSGRIDPSASGATGSQTYRVTLTATDPSGARTSTSFVWGVVDLPPVARDDTATIAEDRAVSIAVLGNDSDPDGDRLSVVPGSLSASHGTVSLNPDGTLRYVPDADFHGTDTILYTIRDGNGGVASAVVTVTVTPVNDAPVAGATPVTTPEDTPVTGRVTARDVDGDPLSFTVEMPPATGSVVLRPDGSFTYTPGADAHGSDGFVVRVSDGHGGSTLVTVPVTVTPVNDAPVASATPATTPEDTPVTGSVTAWDLDGDRLSFTVETPPATGSVVLRPDGSFTYTPGADAHGSDGFVVRVSDGHGGSMLVTVPVTITPVNDAPTATLPPDRSGQDGQNVRLDLGGVFSDVDGDALVYAASGLPPGLSIDPATGLVSGRIDPSASGATGSQTYRVTLTATDPSGARTSTSFVWGVVDLPPVARDDTATIAEDRAVSIAVLGNDSDPDGDRLSVVPGSLSASHGTVSLNPDGTLRYVPDANFHGTDTILYTIRDGNGGVASAVVTVTVTPVNDAPVASATPATTPEDTPVTGSVTAWDLDGDRLSFTVETPPATGSVVLRPDGSFTYTPGADANGSDDFVVRVSDGNGGSTLVTVPVTITPVNDAPTATLPPDRSGQDGQSVRLDLGGVFSDVDGDALVYAASGLPPGLSIDPATGLVSGRIDPSASGATGSQTYRVTLTATDPSGARTSTSFVWGVVDLPPVARDDTATIAEDRAVSIAVLGNDSDPDGDRLSVVPGSLSASHGTVSLNPDGTLRYVPDADFHGTDTILYTIRDGNGGVASAVVTVTVTPVNDAPVAGATPVTTPEDTPVTGRVTARDVDGDPLSFTVEMPPATGSVVLRPDGSFTYTPGADAHGSDGFVVRVSDGHGGSTLVTVPVTVTPVNDAPAGTADPLTIPADTTGTGLIATSDRDGDPVSITLTRPPTNGNVTLQPDGRYTYDPVATFSGDDSFTVTLTDGHGGTSLVEVRITVTPDLVTVPVPPPLVPVLPVVDLPRIVALPSVTATGYVLTAVAEIHGLHSVSDIVLADGAVVAAVNGAAPLHGIDIVNTQPVIQQETHRLDRLAWERFEEVPDARTPWFTARPYLGRSLGLSFSDDTALRDVMVEAIRRPDALALTIRNLAPAGSEVVAVRLYSADGGPAPGWIESDGRGSYWGVPPAGTQRVSLEIAFDTRDGRTVRRALWVDAETGEIRALPARDEAHGPDAALFTRQLAGSGLRGTREMDLIERALAGHPPEPAPADPVPPAARVPADRLVGVRATR